MARLTVVFGWQLEASSQAPRGGGGWGVARDLVGREVDEGRIGRMRPGCLQQLERAVYFDREVGLGVGNGPVVRGLSGGVNDELECRAWFEKRRVIAEESRMSIWIQRNPSQPRASSSLTTRVDASGPKNEARASLSIPSTSNPASASCREVSEPIRPPEPVTIAVGTVYLGNDCLFEDDETTVCAHRTEQAVEGSVDRESRPGEGKRQQTAPDEATRKGIHEPGEPQKLDPP
jgi:hypothetical protein